MRKLIFFALSQVIFFIAFAQSPVRSCTDPVYRQFDFWLGEWEAYNTKGNKAGDSKISLILDSCIILEEWTSSAVPGSKLYTGKSFNTYNANSKQWQQTWVDNAGGSMEFLNGKYDDRKIIFLTNPFHFSKDTMAIRQLTFYNINPDKVRQHGEISKDKGVNWQTEYDLEYRRKK